MTDDVDEVAVYKEQLFVARQQLARQTKLAEEATAEASEARRDGQLQAGRLAQLQHDVRELHDARQRCEELTGTVEALQQEAHRLKSARAVLDDDVAEARSAAEARARDLSQLQGSAALSKARVEEQGGQIRLLKQQLVDLEDEVRRCSCALASCWMYNNLVRMPHQSLPLKRRRCWLEAARRCTAL